MTENATRTVGLIIERSRAFGREICEGVISYAQERDDWRLVFLNAADLRSRAKRSGIDGFIARVTSDAIARSLRATGRPVVDLYYEKPRPGFAIVKTKHEKIGALAAEHFLDRRFRSFAYCPYGGGRTSRYCQLAFARRLRREGFRCVAYKARKSASYEFDDMNVIGETIGLPRDARALEAWVASLRKPVAVFCPGDLRAWQLIGVCRAAGLDVPRDVAVLGMDNDMIICGSIRPMISSIDPATREIGRMAAETIDGMMRNGIPSKPVVRQVEPSGVVSRASTETCPVEPPWLSDALVYIRRNAKNGISAADVFARLGRSHTAVSRMFRSVLGTTVQREIARARLDEARHLLLGTNLSVTEVAALSGFRSVAYLLQSFTPNVGVPPSVWRRMKRNAAPPQRRDGAHR